MRPTHWRVARVRVRAGAPVALLLLWALVDYPGRLYVGHVHASAAATIISLLGAWALVLIVPERPGLSRSGILLLAALLAVAGLASGLTSPAEQMWQNLAVYAAMLGLLLLGSYLRSDRDFRRLSLVALATAAATSLAYCGSVIAEGAGADHPFGPRPYALYALVLAAPALAARRAWPVRSYAVIVLIAVGIFVSESRTATVTIIVFLAIAVVQDVFGRSVHRLAWGAGLAGIVVALTVTLWKASPGIRGRFQERGDSAIHLGNFSISSSGRSQIWKVAWHDFLSSPLVGHGLGSSEGHIRAVFVTVVHPHNDYLKILADIGALGAAVLLVAVVLLLRPLGRRSGTLPSTQAQRIAMARWSLVAMLVAMVTDNPLSYIFVAGPAAFFVGLGLCITDDVGPEEKSGAQDATSFQEVARSSS